jgi:hypothetical protein
MRAELGRASPFSSVVAANGHGISDDFGSSVGRRSGGHPYTATHGREPSGHRYSVVVGLVAVCCSQMLNRESGLWPVASSAGEASTVHLTAPRGVVRPRRAVRLARLIHAARRRRSWWTCGPRRLRQAKARPSRHVRCRERTAPGAELARPALAAAHRQWCVCWPARCDLRGHGPIITTQPAWGRLPRLQALPWPRGVQPNTKPRTLRRRLQRGSGLAGDRPRGQAASPPRRWPPAASRAWMRSLRPPRVTPCDPSADCLPGVSIAPCTSGHGWGRTGGRAAPARPQSRRLRS